MSRSSQQETSKYITALLIHILGSCVLDCAVGQNFGVAKRASITVVVDRLGIAEHETTIDAWSQVLDDVNQKGIKNKAVIIQASDQGSAAPPFGPAYESFFAKIIKELVTTHAAAVVVSQPNPGKEPSDKFCPGPPCIFGNPQNVNHIPEIITVDAGDINTGEASSVESDRWTTIYAPGNDDLAGADNTLFCLSGQGIIRGGDGSSLGKSIRNSIMFI